MQVAKVGLAAAQRAPETGQMGFAFGVVKSGSLLRCAEQGLHGLLVVTHAHLYQFAVGLVQLLCLRTQLSNGLPRIEGVGGMTAQPCFNCSRSGTDVLRALFDQRGESFGGMGLFAGEVEQGFGVW